MKTVFLNLFRKETPVIKQIVIKQEHPDSLEQDITPDMQRAIAGFFKMSIAGRVLMSNLYEDSLELDRDATTSKGDRDYLCGKAAGFREALAKIQKLCVVPEEKSEKSGDSRTSDDLSAALGPDYEIRVENP
jgi:hypothetical protein